MPDVPDERIRAVNDAPLRPERDLVLYWMIAARRATRSFALDRAAARAREFGRPLVILEALRVGYPHASDRLHRFVLDGMRENARAFARTPARYLPYVEAEPGAGKGLLSALAARACVVVTDDFPAFFLPRMVAAAGARLDVRLEAVDGTGLMPLSAAPKAYGRAVDFRRHLQRELPVHLAATPSARPLAGLPQAPDLPPALLRRWPAAGDAVLAGRTLGRLPLDHSVGVVETAGGAAAARAALGRFVRGPLSRYHEDARHPDADAVSGLSPYLHFGHLSPHEVLEAVADAEGWTPDALGEDARGAREGWWGMGAGAEAFLDQLVTWRELGHVACRLAGDCDRWEGIPEWARRTLALHAGDPRPQRYDADTLDAGATDDPLWNACQRQLAETGTIHGYLRMLWGKRVLTWTRHPEEAFAILVRLNDRYALDGRDPNSYSGISWCFGRYDRPWPEREIFGKVRTMTSESTRRKLRMARWWDRFGAPAEG